MANRNKLGRFTKGHKSLVKGGKRPNFHGNSGSFKKGLVPHNKGRGQFKKCLVCNKEIWVENNQLRRKKFCSKKCLYESGTQTKTFKGGAEHPAWKNGESLNKYPALFNARLKKLIRERDNYTCQLCGKTEEQELEELSRVLCVNHIDFNKENCAEENLNTLCLRCNLLINWDREKWTNYFMEKQGGK